MPKRIELSYGRGKTQLDLPENYATVIEPTPQKVLRDEHQAVLDALDHPVGAPPLREWIQPGHQVCIVFTDITRATPNHRLIPWLLDYLSFVPRNQVTLLNAVGTHRPNTPDELAVLLSPGVAQNYRVINHPCEDPDQLLKIGQMRDGAPALLNRHLVEADVRIITGFIEPHFFAGFSGGPKGILPGVAGLESVLSNHGPHNIGHPKAAFGITTGNPLWEEIEEIALRVGPSFLLNVTLDHERRLTGVFAGDLIEAHRVGCEFVRESAMQRVEEPFDIVVTTNSGYPLDLNLYQGVKGLSAGARILKPGGLLILACECSEGIPANSPYDRLLRSARNPAELLERIQSPGFSWPEQWQVQIQAGIQAKARVQLFSRLSDADTRAAHFEPCRDISRAVEAELHHLGATGRVAILPQGPLTIPYLAD